MSTKAASSIEQVLATLDEVFGAALDTGARAAIAEQAMRATAQGAPETVNDDPFEALNPD